jgi:hypothetical protein
MAIGGMGGTTAPQLQTSWNRAEAACAARHRGDQYYELTHPQTPATPPADAKQPTDASQPAEPLAPGFTLQL